MSDAIQKDLAVLEPDLIALRRDLHRHPELGFGEERTAALAADRARALGLEVRTGVGRTGVVAAPPWNNLILLGITYDLLVRLAAEGALKVEIRPVTEAEVRAADEVWLSSSTKEVLAVTTLDNKPVGDGKPGAVFRRMHALFQEYKAKAGAARAVAA